MRTERWLCISAVTLAFLAGGASARAEVSEVSDRGNALLESGVVAYDQGRLADALAAFELSYRQTHDPQTLFRVADCADKVGNRARALEAFESYLKQVPDSPKRAFVVSRIAANRAALEVVPSAAQVAANGSVAAPPAATGQAQAGSDVAHARDGSPAGPWWVWAAGGTLVVAGIVVAAVLVNSSSSPSVTQPIQGNVGGTVQTLIGR